jgi:hypothetical protein
MPYFSGADSVYPKFVAPCFGAGGHVQHFKQVVAIENVPASASATEVHTDDESRQSVWADLTAIGSATDLGAVAEQALERLVLRRLVEDTKELLRPHGGHG